MDSIDLYYIHRVDGVTPIEKTMEEMVKLKKYVSCCPSTSGHYQQMRHCIN